LRRDKVEIGNSSQEVTAMKRETARKWIISGAALTFWLTLGTLFGPINVRNALRASVVAFMLLAFVVFGANKLVVVYRTKFPLSHPRVAYHAIIARLPESRIIDGYVIGLVREGQKGYSTQHQFGTFADVETATRKASELNAQAGLTEGQVNRLSNRWA
jgi:hypothetical protein